ncbi:MULTISPECIES: hypothetical protein [unclassified Streptomyces]|uniref:hypothetical protein n=1 Tax=unclassified Streptomyces TaxID=2593676 RepID=UPI00093F0E6D|nr:hypothetical protein [Streptomyces sp. TSRI0281]OKI35590.1 hypothetical protein A6A29_11785 [Streptomyces sp. TSRI0281]
MVAPLVQVPVQVPVPVSIPVPVQRRAAGRDMGPVAAPAVRRAPAPALAMDGGGLHVGKAQPLRRLRVVGRMR